MIKTRSTRLLALIVLGGILGGLLVGAGMLEPNPDHNAFPNENEFAVDDTAYVGEQVETAGTVLTINPVVIEVSPDSREPIELTLTNVDPNALQKGDRIAVFGILEADNTFAVAEYTVRQPWELQYMYLVSFIAGLWTLGRFLRHWTIDYQTLAFSPQEID